MSDEKTGRLLLADGPVQLRVFNPAGVLRFANRVCETCEGPIMDHWLRSNPDPELRGTYWCDEAGTQASCGMKID